MSSYRSFYCGAWSFKSQIAGVKAFTYDAEAGEARLLGDFGELIGQSILSISGDKLLSVCERGDSATVVSYAIGEDATLTQTDALSIQSAKLSYITAAPDGKHAFVSSMHDGAVRMLRVGEKGELTLVDEYRLTGHGVTPRQASAKTHSVRLSPDGKTLAAANLGADELVLFDIDYEKERLFLKQTLPVDVAREPRHSTFTPDGRFFYLLTEGGNRVYAYRVANGRLTELAAYDTKDPDGPQTGAAADIIASADGRFLYSTNRGQNNIALWRVLPSGLLDIVGWYDCGGEGPRGLELSPDGKLLFSANNTDDSVTILPVDPETGIPGAPIQKLDVPGAGCVRCL